MWNASVSWLHHCNERMHVNTCVDKSLFQAFESSPVVLLVMSPTVLPTVVPSLMEIRCQLG